MPLIEWERPQYGGCDVVELVTVAPKENHENETIGKFPEHVLMLLHREYPTGKADWGMAWIVHDGNGRWGQRLLTVGPSRDNGDSERKLIRECKEQITGRMS